MADIGNVYNPYNLWFADGNFYEVEATTSGLTLVLHAFYFESKFYFYIASTTILNSSGQSSQTVVMNQLKEYKWPNDMCKKPEENNEEGKGPYRLITSTQTSNGLRNYPVLSTNGLSLKVKRVFTEGTDYQWCTKCPTPNCNLDGDAHCGGNVNNANKNVVDKKLSSKFVNMIYCEIYASEFKADWVSNFSVVIEQDVKNMMGDITPEVGNSNAADDRKQVAIDKHVVRLYATDKKQTPMPLRVALALKRLYEKHVLDVESPLVKALQKYGIFNASNIAAVALFGGKKHSSKKKVYTKTAKKFTGKDGVARVVYTCNNEQYVKRKSTKTGKFYYKHVA